MKLAQIARQGGMRDKGLTCFQVLPLSLICRTSPRTE